MGFRENLKDAIDYSGLEQKEVAYKTKISLRSIENYLRERASVPAADKAVRIAQVLGVSVEYLVTGKNDLTQIPASLDPKIQNLIRCINKLPRNQQFVVIQNALNLAGILSSPDREKAPFSN